MSMTIHIYYDGAPGAARAFAQEMTEKGIVAAIRQEAGNLGYAYYFPMEDANGVLLVDSWESREALQAHHDSPMMATIAALREKYDLHMKVQRFVEVQEDGTDSQYIRK